MNDMESANEISADNDRETIVKKELRNEQLPFVCGYCNSQFDRISPYCLHIKDHNEAADNSFHICDDSDGEPTKFVYRCKKCRMEFPSVCLLHSHMLFCSGSYVYDHEHTMAFPIEDLCMFIKGRSEETNEKEIQTVLTELIDKDIDETVDEIPSRCAVTFATKSRSTHNEENLRLEEVYMQTEVCLKDELDNTITSCDVPGQTKRGRGRPKKNIKNVPKNGKETKHQSKATEEQFCGENEEKNRNEHPNERVHKRLRSTDKHARSVDHTRAVEDDDLSSNYVNGKPSNKIEVNAESEKKSELDDMSPRSIIHLHEDRSSDENCCSEEKVCSSRTSKRNRTVAKRQKKLHVKVKQKKEFCCEVCGKSYVDKSRLKLHSFSHANTRNFVCEICSVSFKYPNHLQGHMKTHSPVTPSEGEKVAPSKGDEKKLLPVKKIRKRRKKEYCDICGKFWWDLSKLKLHMYSHSGAKNFACKICSAAFKYPNHLQEHMKSHNAVLPFYCELCGEGFIAKTRLARHKIGKHSTEKKHHCSECGMGFKFKSSLTRHSLGHTGDKKHQCDVCGQQFSRKCYLVEHLRIHNNTRRFECDVDGCRRKFFTNYQLQCHLKIHSGERPYKCSICPAEFIQRKELRRHLKKAHDRILEAMALEHEAQNIERDEMKPPHLAHSNYDQYLPAITSTMAAGSLVTSDVGLVVAAGMIVSQDSQVKSDEPLQTFHINETLSQDSKDFSMKSLDTSSSRF